MILKAGLSELFADVTVWQRKTKKVGLASFCNAKGRSILNQIYSCIQHAVIDLNMHLDVSMSARSTPGEWCCWVVWKVHGLSMPPLRCKYRMLVTMNYKLFFAKTVWVCALKKLDLCFYAACTKYLRQWSYITSSFLDRSQEPLYDQSSCFKLEIYVLIKNKYAVMAIF